MTYACVYQGKTYRTKKAAMYAAGVDYSRCRSWIQKKGLTGLSLDDAVEKYRADVINAPQKTPPERTKLIYKGREYRNRRALCAAEHVSYTCLLKGMKRGLSPEDAVARCRSLRQRHIASRTDHCGTVFESVEDMCRAWHISREVYKSRIQSGWTLERALATPARGRFLGKLDPVDHTGKKYGSIAEMCGAYKIRAQTYRSRMLTLGWTVEEALTTPVKQYEYKWDKE